MQLFFTISVFFREEFLFTEDLIGLLLGPTGLLIALFEMPLVYLIEKRASMVKAVACGIGLFGLAFIVFLFSRPDYSLHPFAYSS